MSSEGGSSAQLNEATEAASAPALSPQEHFAQWWKDVISGKSQTDVVTGKSQTFDGVVERVDNEVVPMLRASFSLDHDRASNLAQSVLRRVLDSIQNRGRTFEDLSHFYAHLVVRARNLALNEKTKRKTSQGPSEIGSDGVARTLDPADNIGQSPDEAAEQNELLDMVLLGLAASGEQNYLLVISHFEGKSDKAIADLLAERNMPLTAATINKRRSRVIAALRRQLKPSA